MRIIDLREYYHGDIKVYNIKYDANKEIKFSITDLYEGNISKTPTEILFMEISYFHASGTFISISVE